MKKMQKIHEIAQNIYDRNCTKSIRKKLHKICDIAQNIYGRNCIKYIWKELAAKRNIPKYIR